MLTLKRLFGIVLLVFIMNFSVKSFAQTLNESDYKDISQALGFLMGQKSTLNRIKHDYPDLNIKAVKAELMFEGAFGQAENNILREFKKELKDKFLSYIANIQDKSEAILQSQQINREMAVQFIQDVESRSKGEISPSILKTILHYHYLDSPQNELQDGFYSLFSTKGHNKAKGIDFQLELPRSWGQKEGKRPNIIQYFNAGFEDRGVSALIMVLEIDPNDLSIGEYRKLKSLDGCKDLAEDYFTPDGLREIAMGCGLSNIRSYQSRRISLDRWPGALIEYVGEGERVGVRRTLYNRMYMAIYTNYYIFLQCYMSYANSPTDALIQDDKRRFVPIFDYIANSIVINSQYY